MEVSQLQLENGSWGVIDGTIPQFENSNPNQQPVVSPPIVCSAPKKPNIKPFEEPAFVPSTEAESDVQKLQLERIEHEANVNELREQHSKNYWNYSGFVVIVETHFPFPMRFLRATFRSPRDPK